MTVIHCFNAVLHCQFNRELRKLRAQFRNLFGQLMRRDRRRGQHANDAARFSSFEIRCRFGVFNISEYSLHALKVAFARLREREAARGAV